MYISEIRIKNFKKFEETKFQFDHGINVIKGVNEQGKSTLLKAIIAALFIDPASSKYKEEFKSWNKDVYPQLELDFFVGSNLYVISKDFNTKEVVLKDIMSKTEDRSLVSINSKIKEFVGISNEALLKSTACVNHDEMALIESGRKSLQEAIQDISLNEGNIDILGILKDLNLKIEEMQVGLYHPAKNNGILKRLKDEIEQLEQDLGLLKTKESDLGSSREKLSNLEKELKDVDAQIEKYSKTVEDYEKKDSVQKEIDNLNERIKNASLDMEKVGKLSDGIKESESEIEKLGGKGRLEKMDERQKELLSLNQEMQLKHEESSQTPASDVGSETVEVEEKSSFGTIFLITSLLALLLVILGIFLFKLLIYLGLTVVIVNFAIILFLEFRKKSEDKAPKKTDPTQTDIARDEINQKRERINSILSDCGVGDIQEYFTIRTQLIALVSDHNQMKSTIDALLRDKSIDEIKKVLNEDIQKKTELEAKLPPGEVVSKDQYLKDKRELELLNLDKKDINTEITEEKTKLKITDIPPQELKEKEERLESLKTEYEDKIHHLEVLKTIYESLEKAKNDISSNISQNIEEYVKKSLSAITNGRYDSLKMDNDFNIEVFSKEKNAWINPNNNLSKGTVDQIYLSARLALADIITSGKPIPLFFDDPFVSFDEKRRDALVEELKKIATTHEIFLFTCNDFFDSSGKVVYIEEK